MNPVRLRALKAIEKSNRMNPVRYSVLVKTADGINNNVFNRGIGGI
ncbi:MAG: hypothetical protein ABIH18_03745 [Candidatus Omnitrophota bacterium]